MSHSRDKGGSVQELPTLCCPLGQPQGESQSGLAACASYPEVRRHRALWGQRSSLSQVVTVRQGHPRPTGRKRSKTVRALALALAPKPVRSRHPSTCPHWVAHQGGLWRLLLARIRLVASFPRAFSCFCFFDSTLTPCNTLPSFLGLTHIENI